MYCIVQARCGSKRLNRKIFKKILNVSIIERVIKRLKKSKKISNIIIVTSNSGKTCQEFVHYTKCNINLIVIKNNFKVSVRLPES